MRTRTIDAPIPNLDNITRMKDYDIFNIQKSFDIRLSLSSGTGR